MALNKNVELGISRQKKVNRDIKSYLHGDTKTQRKAKAFNFVSLYLCVR